MTVPIYDKNMTLTPDDLQAISKLIDEKLEEKLRPNYEFIDFAKTALVNLLSEKA